MLDSYYTKSVKIKSEKRVIQIGTLLLVKVRGKWSIISAHHYRRLIEILKTLSLTILMSNTAMLLVRTDKYLESFLNVVISAGENNSNT